MSASVGWKWKYYPKYKIFKNIILNLCEITIVEDHLSVCVCVCVFMFPSLANLLEQLGL